MILIKLHINVYWYVCVNQEWFYLSCFFVFTNLNTIMMITPIANANKKVAWGDILSQSNQRIYHPGRETIPIAVWNTPNAVPLYFPAKSTTSALSVPSTIANRNPNKINNAITRQSCVTKASHNVTTKNKLYAIHSIFFLPMRSESIPNGVEAIVYIP